MPIIKEKKMAVLDNDADAAINKGQVNKSCQSTCDESFLNKNAQLVQLRAQARAI